ncbi:MAG: hypothetical protein ACAH27_05610 [Xanthobacteraceae bacterium]
MSEAKVIIVHRTVLEMWLKDAAKIALFIALIGIGRFIGSTVMEIVGAILAFMLIGIRVASFTKNNATDIAGARARLDALEAGRV